MSDHTPMTLAEQLDAARSGEEFGEAIQGLFRSLEAAKDAEYASQERA